MYSILILYALVAVGFSFFCSVAEAVLLSVSPSFIASLKEKGKPSANLLERLKSNVDRPLAAILTLNTVAHTVGAAGVGAEAAKIWGMEHSGGHAVGWASAVMTLVILVFSEIIPKTIGAVYWRSLAVPIAIMVNWMIKILYPLVILSEKLTQLIGGGERHGVVTRSEVAAMAAISAQGGYLEESESRIVANLFNLRDLVAENVMTPRTVIRAFPESMTVQQVVEQQPTIAVSRIPVYGRDIDDITGFVLKSDIFLALAKDQHETQLKDIRREIAAVPANTPLLELFDKLLNQRAHISIVVDEYGGTDGLVTLEDVIETLLGMEIVDEADRTENMQRLARKQWEKRATAIGIDLSQPVQHPAGKQEEAEQSKDSTEQDSQKNS